MWGMDRHCNGAGLRCNQVCCRFGVAADNSGPPSSRKRLTVHALRHVRMGHRLPALLLIGAARDKWAVLLASVGASLLPARAETDWRCQRRSESRLNWAV